LIQRELYARVPVYPELEYDAVFFTRTHARMLGPDDPASQIAVQGSPQALATRLIAETKLDDADVRKLLWQAARPCDASLDPMIALARAVDADARAIRSDTTMK